MTAKQFQALVGESISDTDLNALVSEVTELDTKLTKIEDEIMEWELTHDMAAPGALKRKHDSIKAERAKSQRNLNALRARAKIGQGR